FKPFDWEEGKSVATTDINSGGTLQEFFLRKRRYRVRWAGKHIIRTLSQFLRRQSTFEDAPVLDHAQFPGLKAFPENWETIRDEVQEILKHRDAIPLFHEISKEQQRISLGTKWRTFILFGFGEKLEKNCAQAPVTASLLEKVPNLQTAWFSILGPNHHIPAHRGVTTGILRAHLGVIVPKQAEKCRLRVLDEMVVWREGEMFVFDDTYEHEVWNDTDDERVVLILDFDRPMGVLGRAFNKLFVNGLKYTAYFREPRAKMQGYEDHFEQVVRRAEETAEKMSYN
ncbi:MAG: aspartyl/asparaginyl beta-hydroxylase domain-containing protein, partial [Hyphomicrobiales bacterium]